MFDLDPHLNELRRQVRDFADHELLPQGPILERNKNHPKDMFRRLGEIGYLDLSFYNHRADAAYNCAESMVILEEIARGLPSIALTMSPHIQCMNLLALNGSERLKTQIVPKAIRGEHLLSFALSESTGGSDALGINTLARRDGSGWIINGEKCWITGAGAAAGYIVAARGSDSVRSRDVSLFYVPADTPGLDDSERVWLTGMDNSPTGIIRFQDCKIPGDCLIGRENDAYGLIKILLNEGRLDMAALGIGIAQGAMECAIHHTKNSGRYGRSLSSYQGISFPVARMYEKIFAARSMLFHVAALFDSQQRVTAEVATLKLFASEMCCEVCRAAVQVHGARGLRRYSDVERYFRDAQMLTISEGTSEVCQIIISRKLYNAEPGEY